MLDGARLKLILYACIGRLSEVVDVVSEDDVKIPAAIVEIVVPNLHAEHEVALASCGKIKRLRVFSVSG